MAENYAHSRGLFGGAGLRGRGVSGQPKEWPRLLPASSSFFIAPAVSLRVVPRDVTRTIPVTLSHHHLLATGSTQIAAKPGLNSHGFSFAFCFVPQCFRG